LRWPAHEILVVDDGSTDQTSSIAASFPHVRLIQQAPSGLSVARNTAAAAATGDIFVYTDDDCVPEEDWLIRLAWLFHDSRWAAGGGPNIPPPPRNATEAVVGAAPGGPTHVLIDEEEAEHIPGCNLAVRREAFEAIGGFNPVFHAAGDDVDFCWRLRDAGFRIGFQAAAMVWHYRRFRVRIITNNRVVMEKRNRSLWPLIRNALAGSVGGPLARTHLRGARTDGTSKAALFTKGFSASRRIN
jgi:O-antigen biosynthesis protein